MEDFIQLIMKNLNNNGFPNKSVSLPLEKLYEAAENKGLSFNDVRAELEKQDIETESNDDKIIFRAIQRNDQFDPSQMDPEMLKKAQEMMGNMSKEELEQMTRMVSDMNPSEREEMLKKAKNMGMF